MIGRVKKLYKKWRLKFSIIAHAFFKGMKNADDRVMGMTKEGENASSGVEEQIAEKGVLNDLLKGEVTQEVKELRDSNYRVYRHADDYQYLGNGNVMAKVKNMLQDDLKVYNPEDFKVLLIQDNKLVVKGLLESVENVEVEGDVVDEDKNERFTLKIKRNVFPRFLIEKWVKKIVVRQGDNDIKLDLYCSSYCRQFMPIDSLFINEMMNIYGKKTKNIDTVDINSIEFITDKAYNSKDLLSYRFEDMKYEKMSMYDKDFVITYSTPINYNLVDITEQFRTKEMDEKYATKARKTDKETVLSLEDYEMMRAQDTLDTGEALKLLKNLENSDF